MMSGDDIGRLAYLILLVIAVGGWFLAENRASLGKTARHAAVWGLIFIGVIAGVGLWADIRDDIMPRQSLVGPGQIEVPVGTDGHYHLTLRVNDVPVHFVVDTGASDVVLTLQDAQRVGLDPDQLNFSGVANTANGVVRTARAQLQTVQLGDITDHGLRVSVNQGEMSDSLLGMAYLQRFERIEIAGDRLILTR